jgi:phage major head subunit gpT-like protein
VIDDLIDRGVTLEDSRMHVLNDIVARGSVAIRSGGRDHNAMSLDNPEVFQRAAGEALYNRLRPDFKPSPQAAPFINMSCTDLARECLRRAGQPTQGLAPPTLITRALQSSSDYPLLLQNILDKSLRDAYAVAESGIRRIARETTANDFRAKSRIQFDASGFRLEIVPETGEFKTGSFIDSAESYSLATFGKIFSISRQALVNDNLGAFGDLTRRMGMQAAEFERQFLANLLMSNPIMSDGVAMFAAAHANIAAVPSVPSEQSLSDGRVAMRSQVGPGGGLVSVIPRYLMCPPELETTCEKLITSIQAIQTEDVNTFAFLDLVVEPRLFNPTQWYLFADPALTESIEYSYLAGEPGPQTSTKVGFEIDGVSVKVRLDYGGAAVEFRSAYTNAGVTA